MPPRHPSEFRHGVPARPHPARVRSAAAPGRPVRALAAMKVILVRHAERTGSGSDPVLSPAGLARAKLLAHMLADAGLTRVFVTQWRRSVQTGTPAAMAAGLKLTPYDAGDAAGLAATIRGSHGNGTALVVAHSDRIDDTAEALGASGVGELLEGQFDRMFIITRRWCGTTLLLLRYGAPTS